MAAHIGIVACSAEGAALCYRTICQEAGQRMGEHDHPEITMHTHSLATYMPYIRSGDWPSVAELMLSSAGKLARAGAAFAVCPDNTIHEAFDLVAGCCPIPWLHIAEAVAREAERRGFGRVGLLGTRYLMTGPVYPGTLEHTGIACEIPDAPTRTRIDDIIFKELVNGVIHEDSRRLFLDVIERFAQRGCDAVVLGCTEIPLIVEPHASALPTLDSTRLLAKAALAESLARG